MLTLNSKKTITFQGKALNLPRVLVVFFVFVFFVLNLLGLLIYSHSGRELAEIKRIKKQALLIQKQKKQISNIYKTTPPSPSIFVEQLQAKFQINLSETSSKKRSLFTDKTYELSRPKQLSLANLSEALYLIESNYPDHLSKVNELSFTPNLFGRGVNLDHLNFTIKTPLQ